MDTQFNAGEARIYGLETTMNGKVGLGLGVVAHLRGAYTYTLAEFETGFQSGFAQWGDVSEGDRFPYVPEHQLSMGATITRGRADLDLTYTVTGEMRDIAGQGAIDDADLIPANRILDLVIGYNPEMVHESI